MSLEIMLFKKWADHGFLHSQARSHRDKQVERMRKTAHGELTTETH